VARLGRFNPWNDPGIHCTGGWVDTGTGLEVAENLAVTGIRSSNRPARSEPLYRLRCPVHCRCFGGTPCVTISQNINGISF
jgi:hypothetical protein